MSGRVIEQLKKDAQKALRKYQRLQRLHRQFIEEIMRFGPSDPRQPELEREKRKVLRQIADLAGPLEIGAVRKLPGGVR